MKSVVPEKFLGHILWPISQERDAEEIFLTRELDCVLKQHRAVAVALKLFMYHKVFEQNHESALGRADGEEQIDHSDDHAITSEHEHATPARLFENQTQSAKLFLFVRTKIALLGEKFTEHLGQLVQIRFGSWLNDDSFAHSLVSCIAYSQKSRALATRESTIDIPRLSKLTIPRSILR